MQMRRHESEVNKMKEQAIRHKKNTILEKEKFKQKAHDNQEKIMQKYITFFWNRKDREKKKKNKFIHFNEKYDEIYNKLDEIERAKEKKQKKLEKKLLSIDTAQKEYLEKEKLKYGDITQKEEIKKLMDEKFNFLRTKNNEIYKIRKTHFYY